MDRIEFEVFSKKVNDVIFYLYEQQTPVRAATIYSAFLEKNIQLDILDIMAEINRLGIVELSRHPTATTGSTMYLLKTDARTKIRYLPFAFENKPYEFFLDKKPLPAYHFKNLAAANKSLKPEESNATPKTKKKIDWETLLKIISGIILIVLAILKFFGLL